MNNKDDDKKLDAILSTAFYNYHRIFTKIYTVFLSTYVDKTQKGLLLKEEYIEGGDALLEQSFIDIFSRVISMAGANIDNKKGALVTDKKRLSNSQIIDSYSLLKNTLKSFDILVSMFGNYPKYLNDFHLNEQSKRIRGILIEKGDELSMEKLRAYLKNFNNIDDSSLRVANDFREDGYYDLQVKILGSDFSFRLWEQDHIIADISYTDTFGEKHVFSNITIALDQKKEQFDELKSSSEDPMLQYKYDFRNFFEVTFLKKDLMVSEEQTSPKDLLETSPEIRLFIQKELLEKDFKNIKDFLSIDFKNITASINDGNYIIALKNLNKTFIGNSTNYLVDLKSDYIFNRHSFSRLSFRVKRDGGAE